MSPTIRIDDDVFEALQKQAKPFVDTPNDVLRRVLRLNGATHSAARNTTTFDNRGSVSIDEPVMLIRINRRYRDGMPSGELYEVTRRAWRVSRRREDAQLALAVYQGVVREVYEIHDWNKATPKADDRPWLGERWEFHGSEAAEPVRSKYLGRRVAAYFTRGAQNPITYVNC